MLPSTITNMNYHKGGEPIRIVVDLPVPITAEDGPPAVVAQVTGTDYCTGKHVFSIDLYEPLVSGFVPR